jgi:hypothetical protein
MITNMALSASEFASLQEVTKGFEQSAIPEADALRLLDLGLTYKLLGLLRITRAGRGRIASGS